MSIIKFSRSTVYKRFTDFFHTPIAGGVVLFGCMLLAMILANLPFTKDFYHDIWSSYFMIGFENFKISFSLEHWINDGLMIIFFFVVGLEIKREVIVGELSSFKDALLPIVAAVGGMVVPALFYYIFNGGTPTESGWGIPMATDIAFALGILFLMGNKVPMSLKIFLTALAIVDDLGAIVVIAMFYSGGINWLLLGWALIILIGMVFLNRMGVDKMRYYVAPSIVLWILFLYSGVHATIAGVLIAMTIPVVPKLPKRFFTYKTRALLNSFNSLDRREHGLIQNHDQFKIVHRMNSIAKETIPLSQWLENNLHGLVAYFIMPVFAFANAGITISPESFSSLGSEQSIGIITGLVLGKPVGIFILCYLTVKLGFAKLPQGASWMSLLAVACMGGIGFTMSMFINNLAFSDATMIDNGKLSILVASIVAAVLGCVLMTLAAKKK